MTPRLRRLWWSFLDQGLISVTGAVVTVQGAATLPPAEFGRLSAALAIYYFMLTAIRALVSEVYLVRFAGAPDRVPPGVARWAQVTTVRLSLVAAAVVLAAAAAAPLSTSSRLTLTALAAALPLLLWQQVRRSVLLAAARPARSAASSGLVLVGQVVGGLALQATVGVSAPGLLFCWAAAGALAIRYMPVTERPAPVAGAVADRRQPRDGSLRWLAEGRAFWPRFLCQDMAQGGASQVALLVVAGISGTVVVAGLRAALLLLAPLLVLQQAAGYIALAEATRLHPAHRLRFILVAQAGAVLAAAVWLVLLDLLPRTALELVAGDNLAGGMSALPGMAVFIIASLLLSAPAAVLRSSGHVQAGMTLGLALMPALIGIPALVAGRGGSVGEVAAGFGVFGLLAVVVWIPACVSVLRTRRGEPGAGPRPPGLAEPASAAGE